MAEFYAIVWRGKDKGIEVTPHKYRNGLYQVKRRKRDRPTYVELHELAEYIEDGYGVRMGNRDERHPPGLFMPESIRIR
jgi:hypothetical protein